MQQLQRKEQQKAETKQAQKEGNTAPADGVNRPTQNNQLDVYI
ncbi:hypothetical protein [Pantoea sp. Fr+CA_20]